MMIRFEMIEGNGKIMEGVILTLCLSLTCVLVGILLSGGLRLREGYEQLRAEMEDGRNAPRTILVKQSAGEMKLLYSVEPQAKAFRRDLAREIAVIRAAQESDLFFPDGDVAERNGDLAERNDDPTERPEGEFSPKEEAQEADGLQERRPQEDEVLIRRAEKLDFSEKYERLGKEERALLDDFSAYLEAVPFCEKRAQAGGLVFRYKKETIAKASIRRGAAVLEFHILNPDLGRMLREEHLKSMKVQPARIRLTGKKELLLAERTADLTVRFLQNEENYLRDKRKAARREAARRKRAEGGSVQ